MNIKNGEEAMSDPVAENLAVAIIPALNEEGRIGPVVKVAHSSGLFTEIVVIDDGSTDGTAAEAERNGARVIAQSLNGGKGKAMYAGVAATREPVICFLDADLLYVTDDHLRKLVVPVTAGLTLTSFARFSQGPIWTTAAQLLAPKLSGQRCIRREVLEGFDDWDTGFGIEIALEEYLKAKRIPRYIVKWRGAGQVSKEEKFGLRIGIINRIKMWKDIFRSWRKNRRRI